MTTTNTDEDCFEKKTDAALGLSSRSTMTGDQRIPILIAEDSEDNRFLLQAYCKGTAYEPTFAEDGEKAVAAFVAGSFEIVIMDMQMPAMDGLSATRVIRGLESDRGKKRTPILVLTANVMPDDIALAREAGCDIHLPKPISRKRFLSAPEQWKPALVAVDRTTPIEMQSVPEQ